MDVGKFKATRTRLVLWILLPPLLAAVPVLGAHLLRLRSQWELDRIRKLGDVLPQLVQTQRRADGLVADFAASNAGAVTTEDGLISFLQETARDAAFTVDSLKVERRTVAGNPALPLLVATVKGTGTFGAIQKYIGDAAVRQQLVSERSLQIAQASSALGEQDALRAEIVFELVVFSAARTAAGGRP